MYTYRGDDQPAADAAEDERESMPDKRHGGNSDSPTAGPGRFIVTSRGKWQVSEAAIDRGREDAGASFLTPGRSGGGSSSGLNTSPKKFSTGGVLCHKKS